MHSIDWRLKRQRRSFKGMLIVVAAAIVLTFYVNATIAMESCSGIAATPTKKLVISRFAATGLTDSEQNKGESYPFFAADRLKANLFEALKVEFDVINCNHRSPNPDFTDFRPDIVNELRDRHVLFETWGNLATSLMNKQTAAEGNVIYFVIPAPDSSWPVPAGLRWGYRNQNVLLYDLYNRIFTRGHHFEVLAAVAYGIEESRNHEYDKAQAALCKAKAMVLQNVENSVWGDLSLNTQKLTDAIEILAKQNVKNAQADSAYRTALTLPAIQATAGNICPKE
jgi:hypothetical protein